jgi:hypothetical protein
MSGATIEAEAVAVSEAVALLVTRHFSLRWGGGEHSIAAVVDEMKAARPDWAWAVTDGGFDPPDRLRPLPLMQLLVRRDELCRAAQAFRGRLALIQSLVGPAMLNAMPESVATVYFLRDVAYWDQWPNHERGLRRAAKSLYRTAMAPAVLAFRQDVRLAMGRAGLLVANSAFMAGRIRAFAGRDSLVVFPRTPVAPAPLPAGTVVGVVGDGADKGGLMVRALARRFPHLTFRIHARRLAAEPLPPNVVVAGWETDHARLYDGVRLMLMPSQVEEAYGRVAAEALGFGVPVLVSRTGGLPEAVPGPDWTVEDYRNPEAWCAAFAGAWDGAPDRRDEAHRFAVARGREVDEQHHYLARQVVALVEAGGVEAGGVEALGARPA